MTDKTKCGNDTVLSRSLVATMVGGIATAVGVLVMLVAVLVAMYCVYLQRRKLPRCLSRRCMRNVHNSLLFLILSMDDSISYTIIK